MSVCPKCGGKLHLLNLGQDCPHCGVNMRFYKFDEQFITDAKMSELSLANVHVKIRNMKTAYIGGALPKARLCVMILPLLSTLLPVANVQLRLPFSEQGVALGTLGLVSAFTDGTFGFVSAMAGSGVFGEAYTALKTAFFSVAATAGFAFFCLLFTLLSFLSLKKMPKVLCATSGLGILAACSSVFFAMKLSSAAAVFPDGAISAKLSFGFAVTIAAFLAVFIINLLIAVKGLHPVYEEGDLERLEIRKKVRSGEISLESLPQPIVETAATRAIDAEIEKEQQRFKDREEQPV